jgi:hypothetical protein
MVFGQSVFVLSKGIGFTNGALVFKFIFAECEAEKEKVDWPV